MALPDINFQKIRAHRGSQDHGFEELCCQIASLEPRPASDTFYRKGIGADAGVECFAKHADQTETGWQVKWFWTFGASQITQLLSGLLICDACSAHYTIANQTSYGCSSYNNGRACSNSIKVRRERIESILLDPIRKELLSPKRAGRMAREMQAYFVERSQEAQARAAEQPHELQEISARIDRRRARLRQGDVDMTADELQAAIDRAETKKGKLEEQQPDSLPAVNVLSFEPRAAELYRRQITLGLEGDPRATLKVRMILRDLFGGEIRLVPQLDGGLTAHWNLHPGALLSGLGKVAGARF
jgi:site-specific DNA recombinase